MPNPDLRRVLFAHTVLIERYGGAEGVRDLGTLNAAIERQWGLSFGQEHFASPYEKAAALCESLIRRHPFSGREQEDRRDDGRLPAVHVRPRVEATQ